MTTTQGAGPMEGNAEVLVQIAELRGQLTTFITIATRLDNGHSNMENKVSAIDNRLTAVEATKRAVPPWYVWAPAICTLLLGAFVVFDKVGK